MAKFIATIQLENANANDYEILLRELKKKAFKSEKHTSGSDVLITSGEETFTREGHISLQDVTKELLKAVEKTGKKFSFFTVLNKAVAAAI